MIHRTALLPLLLLTACGVDARVEDPALVANDGAAAMRSGNSDTLPSVEPRLATFAGGCFWCVEAPFEKVPGVLEVVSGYCGGDDPDPTYKEVCSGTTGHTEAVQITYDPTRVSYDDLLEIFWRQIDPTDSGGQFVDRGSQYRSEIFTHSEEQRLAAEASRDRLGKSGRFDTRILTAITPLETFYPAEDYHQDFYKKSTARYESYRSGSGRDAYLDRVWGEDRTFEPAGGTTWEKPSDEELRERLTDLQYRVTQKDDTERAFTGEYWDNHEEGLYVDIVSGEALFSSRDKFDSGTGWPSFTRPITETALRFSSDKKLGYVRSEVRSALADSHLGHVFDDGPKPTGLRYCINSAALRFVPVDRLEEEGYGAFAPGFADAAEAEAADH